MEKLVGRVKHFYAHIPAAIVELEDDLKIGDQIIVRNKKGDEKFRQTVESMEVEHKKISEAKAGEEVSIQVVGKTKEGDLVYKEV